VIALTIYSRPGCHLCDEMKTLVEQVVNESRLAVRFDEINVETEPELEARYGSEVPVLLVDGKKTAKYRVTRTELTRILSAR
jgi:glutaredoxin